MPFETTLLAHPAWHLDHEADPPRISVISLANRERITTSLALPQCQPGTVRALRRPLAFSDDDLHLARALHALALRATPPVAFDPLSILAAARFTSPLDLTDLGCLVVHERTARVLRAFIRVPALGVIAPPWLPAPMSVVALRRHGGRLVGVSLDEYSYGVQPDGDPRKVPALTAVIFPDRSLTIRCALAGRG